MKTSRPLIPAFLKKAENKLLKKQPELWSTRAHLVLYYGIISIVVLAAIAFVVPDDPRTRSSAGYWIGFVSIISILGLVVWLIWLLRFNLFKRYGLLKPLDRLTTFILYFFSAAIIVFFTYVEPLVESYKANKAYGNDEIVNDVNSINTLINQIDYHSIKHVWSRNPVRVVPESRRDQYRQEESSDSVGVISLSSYALIDSADFNRRASTADSIVKVNDSMYIFYTVPEYALINMYAADNRSSVHLLSSYDIYKTIVRNYSIPDKKVLAERLTSLQQKYTVQNQPNELYTADDYRTIYRKYGLGDIQNSFDNIVDRKYRWSDSSLSAYIRLLYYISLAIALLIFIFRHTTVKTFFLSMLTAVIITILTALFMAFGSSEDTFLTLLLIYAFVFFVVSLGTWKSKVRSVITGISINLLAFMTPLLPMMMVARYYAGLRQKQMINAAVEYDFTNEDRNIWYAEVGGSILLLLLLATFFKAVYRRWYAQPEQ